MLKTREQIRVDGLVALRRALGRAGMIRFLHQFDLGHGDYATERRAWVERTSLEDIRSPSNRPRSKRASRRTVTKT
jgi:hypothetical protein